MRDRLRNRDLKWLAAVVAPWTWFVWRDLLPELDGLAIVMPVLLLLVLLGLVSVSVYRRNARWLIVAVSTLALGLAAIVGPWLPQGGDDPLHGLQLAAVNVSVEEREFSGAVVDLQRTGADVLVISEMWRREQVEAVGSLYEYSVRGEQNRGVVVFSRWPLTPIDTAPDVVQRLGLAVEVTTPNESFVLWALHLPRPWPQTSENWNTSLRGHRSLIDELSAAVRNEPRPVVIAGDLNLPDRTSGYRELTSGLKDAMRSTWGGPTSLRWAPLLLRIDHILIPGDWCADRSHRFSVAGADHRGVSSVIGACPGS